MTPDLLGYRNCQSEAAVCFGVNLITSMHPGLLQSTYAPIRRHHVSAGRRHPA
jgi:hypothetical protein